MQTNTQPREGMTGTGDDGKTLDVVSIWRTIQGEGPFAGSPAVFIRLAGCNLNCDWCDTDYTSNRLKWEIESIVSKVTSLLGQLHSRLVVITGGEPFRQNIEPLVALLLCKSYKVQIETNGTLYRELPWDSITGAPRQLFIVCSPKKSKVHPMLQKHVDALKYVADCHSIDRSDGLPVQVLGQMTGVARPWDGYEGEIYLQPEDHQNVIENAKNQEAVLEACMKHGYRFCLQLHKFLKME